MTSLNDFRNVFSQFLRNPTSLQNLKLLYDDIGGNFKWSAGVTPLSTWPVLFGTLAAYLVISYGLNFILGEKKDHTKEKPTLWDKFMKYCALLHNFNMMVISFVCLIGLVYEVSVAYTKDGMYAIICDPHQKYNNGKIIIWIYFYYISKYIELFDTFLLVLRRSQLRFIHTYHHVTTMFITFFGLATGGTGQWIIITLNVFVHVIMYYYYVQVTLGRHVWWKTYVTDIQLTQFAIDVLFLSYYIYAELVYERPIGNSCSGDLTGAILCDIIVSSFFVLFFQLRQRNLRAARAKESSQKQQSLEKKLQ